ncbi:MAG: hypothetical protein B7Y80_17230 [Hyphomicrobium sp. 32-62-53]|nr:MAG: hypothetical protein B7Z29_08330 [Hyphomicrobium sp. 12-62-95]OYX98114.1 MAG: hypothetical protein B7Y80_17230 [Hyphomicrobium sp. 32-62-53]
MRMSKDDKVGQALRGLEEASRGTLVAQWRRHYRSEPPRYASVEFMRQAIAYAIQERELGGLPASAQRELLAIAKGTQPAGTSSKIKIKPGTKLLREWDGKTHEMLVTDRGFVWNGATYGSLSAVAMAITGAKWSGQRFFGLLKKRGGQGD